MRAEVGDIVTFTDPAGRAHIGRVAASLELPPDYAPSTRVSVATPDGDFTVDVTALRVVRPNFVQETWNALGHDGPAPWAAGGHS